MLGADCRDEELISNYDKYWKHDKFGFFVMFSRLMNPTTSSKAAVRVHTDEEKVHDEKFLSHACSLWY